MAIEENDPRLFGQYLPPRGSVFTLTKYELPPRNFGDHDHCTCCFRRIAAAEAGYDDSVEVGYTTPNESGWICTKCFDDFRDRSEWTAEGKN
jgi:hypothetical protein